MDDYIARAKYQARVQPFVAKNIIKVLIGQRRVGKSYLLRQLRDQIAAADAKAHFIYVDKEQESFNHVLTASDLSAYIQANMVTDRMNYVMIDEIQEITDFENCIRSFASRSDFDLYITGSNSQLLSVELATRLSGRYIEIPVYSLDFKEFVQFHGLEKNLEGLQNFLHYGGMPFLKNLELKDEIVFEYLKNVLTTVLYRDIIARYKIRNVQFLNRLVNFTADNIGNILNASKINAYLKSQYIAISVNSILDYLSHLTAGQLLVPIKRIDLKGKRLFEVGEKYYFQDLGIRNALIGYRAADLGKMMENCVCQHLLSHGYSVFTGDWQQREIDFVAEKNNERTYIQVALRIDDPATHEREFGNLLLIPDNYPKMVVTLEAAEGNTYQGVEHWGLLRFLEEFE
jgi:predicted AAA+ superfamily ATPase